MNKKSGMDSKSALSLALGNDVSHGTQKNLSHSPPSKMLASLHEWQGSLKLKSLKFARVCKHPHTLDLNAGGHKSRIPIPTFTPRIRMFAGGRTEKFVNVPQPPDYLWFQLDCWITLGETILSVLMTPRRRH